MVSLFKFSLCPQHLGESLTKYSKGAGYHVSAQRKHEQGLRQTPAPCICGRVSLSHQIWK